MVAQPFSAFRFSYFFSNVSSIGNEITGRNLELALDHRETDYTHIQKFPWPKKLVGTLSRPIEDRDFYKGFTGPYFAFLL